MKKKERYSYQITTGVGTLYGRVYLSFFLPRDSLIDDPQSLTCNSRIQKAVNTTRIKAVDVN